MGPRAGSYGLGLPALDRRERSIPGGSRAGSPMDTGYADTRGGRATQLEMQLSSMVSFRDGHANPHSRGSSSSSSRVC